MIDLLIQKYKDLKSMIAEYTKLQKDVRMQIILYMKDNNVESFESKLGTAKLQQPRSFDVGMLKAVKRELYDKFTTMRTIPAREEPFFDKEAFKELYPQVFKEFNIDLTPRLTVK